eukprot:5167527-Amphidinium_carterae.5
MCPSFDQRLLPVVVRCWAVKCSTGSRTALDHTMHIDCPQGSHIQTFIQYLHSAHESSGALSDAFGICVGLLLATSTVLLRGVAALFPTYQQQDVWERWKRFRVQQPRS